MATTSNTYTGNGSNKLFSITFPYLNTTDIDVYLNGTLQTVTTQYTFANATTVEFVTSPSNGATVLLRRSTDDTTLAATFFAGSSIRAADLNDNFDQVLYIAQETNNNVANAVAGQIPDGTITNVKLATDSVASSNIIDGTIVNADVNASAGITAGKLSFTQAGTGASVRTVDSKLKDVVSVKDFGAVGDGVADDTAAIQAAINSSLRIEFQKGSVYKITAPLIITAAGTYLIGNGARIVGSYEQNPTTPLASESMLFVNGADYVRVQDLRLQYTGTFSVGGTTVSYGGYVSCIQVENSDDFTADNVEAYGANRSGINIGYMLTGTPAYCERPMVINCYLHNNRVAGVSLGNTRDAIVRGCQLTFNGHVDDGGTGYGSAGWAACEPVNTLIDSNQANDNFRKGIDFHSGLNGIVTNNVCARNRIYGIYVMGNRGAFTISNNLVTNMTGPNAFGLAIFGIRVGALIGQGGAEIPTSYVIDGNVINEFNLASGVDGYPIADSMVGCSYGRLVITNNTIDAGRIGQIHNSSSTATSGVAGNYYDVNYSGNVINVGTCASTTQCILFNSSNNRQKLFSNNTVNITSVTGTSGIAAYAVTSIANRCWIATGNNITSPTTGWSSINEPIQIRRVTNEKQIGTVVNGAVWRDWDGYKFVDGGTAIPTTNFWSQGSIVTKTTAAAGGEPGWVCTTAGTPGTWKAMANLAV
jgi:hypothetical protein